jgi:peroxiredoxin
MAQPQMKSQLLAFLVILAIFQLPTDCLGQTDSKLDDEVKASTLVKVGQEAPDFAGLTTDSRNITLSSLKGKVVVLYFFSVRVPPCIIEMKYLEKEVYQKLRNRPDFQMIGIGRANTRDELVTLGGENKLTFPLVPDPTVNIYERYFTKYTPRTVVVGKNGSITYIANGYNEYAGIVKLQAILARELSINSP